jgi:hypothetical protein
MALLTKQGISTDMAATSLRATITALINPAKQAADMFDNLGIRSGTTAIRQEGLAKTLLAVAKAAETDADVLSQLIPNVRALMGVAALGTDALVEFDEILRDVKTDFGENSSLAEALALQMTTLETKIDQAGGAWRNFILSITEQEEGSATEVINLWVWAFNKMAEANREVYERLGLSHQAFIKETTDSIKEQAKEQERLLSEVADERLSLIEKYMISENNAYNELSKKDKKAADVRIGNYISAYYAVKELREKALKDEQETQDLITDEVKKLEKEKFENWKVLEELRIKLMEDGYEKEIAIEELKYKIELEKYKDNLDAKLLLYQIHKQNIAEIDAEYAKPEAIEAAIPSLLPPVEFTEDELALHNALVEEALKYEEEINLDAQVRMDAVRKKYDELDMQRKLQGFQQAAGAASQFFGALSSMYQAQMNKELQQTNLTEKQKEAIMRKYHKKEQQAAVIQAIINGAVGVTQAFAQGGIIGFITGALIAAATAIQIETIRSQKFAKGTYKVLKGARHAQGGIDVGVGEAEDGEGMAIFSRPATKKYAKVLPDLIRAINNQKLGMMDISHTDKIGKKADLMLHRVSLDDSKDLKAIRRLLEKQPNVRIEGGYRIVERPGLIQKFRLK